MATLSLIKRQAPGEGLDPARPFGFYAPHWARYVVMDRNGTVWAHERCPFVASRQGTWVGRVDNGRFAIVGTHPGDHVDWQESLHYRKGGLWVSAREELIAEGKRRVHDVLLGATRFLVLMSAIVAAIQALWWSGQVG